MDRTELGRKIPERILERQEVSPAALGLVLVLAFVAFAYVPFMGKAYTMDEPLFLAPALHILKDPLHPLAFPFNWYGQTVPMSSINNTPPLFLYLLALALKCTGGRPFAMRLFFLPLDFLAATSLFLLAGRFLKKPLVPVLVALASPGFLVGLNLLYPDKAATAFGFFGLYAWIRGLDEESSGWTSAALGALALALLAKYLAVVFLVPAAAYAAAGRRPLKKILLPAAALAPVGVYLAINLLHGGAAFSSAWRTTAQSLGAASWARRWRAVLAGVGGCCAAGSLWPFCAGRPRWKAAAAALSAAFLFFIPFWDAAGPAPALLARATGIAMAFAALYGMA
ncbi:MAG: glycosyltransferase family 39 protein, partial [Elusimicrobia bacterium]|nr:glycosyltransferase family 39 protein [Elusimicrobiota bacterium]